MSCSEARLVLSQTTEYALRAVVCIAQGQGGPVVTEQIAATTRVPAGYLSKVLQTLTRSGLVCSRRGLHGGFYLAKPPEEISVLDIVNAVDPLKRITSCPLKITEHGSDLCALHRRLDDAMGLIEASFAEASVADLLGQPGHSPLCTEDQAGAALRVQPPPEV